MVPLLITNVAVVATNVSLIFDLALDFIWTIFTFKSLILCIIAITLHVVAAMIFVAYEIESMLDFSYEI